MSEIVKIAIPSFKRANMVLTDKVVGHRCVLVVPERQVAEYRKHNPKTEVVGHPDSVVGISAARQWIYDTFKNVMMLDDDIESVHRLMMPPEFEKSEEQLELGNKLTAEEAYEVIQSLADMARQMGAYLFGFTSAVNPRDVRPQRPFSMNGYVKGTTMGLLEGSKLHFPLEPEGKTSEDHYVTLLNAYYHRYCLIDNRFGFKHIETFRRAGGVSDYRTYADEEKAYRFLKRKFGNAIQLKGADRAGKVKRTHEWERVVNIPY